MTTGWGTSKWAIVPSLAACAAASLACGGQGSTPLGPGGATSGTNGDGDAGGAQEPAGSTVSDAGTGGTFFAPSDAGSSTSGIAVACQPGTYSGTFMTNVSSDAGGLFSLFSFSWTGSLSVALTGMVTQTSSGEFESSVLTIAPGAKLSGTDSLGGRFDADLTGQLDCPTKMFTATLANGTYTYPGDASVIMMTGALSATYAAMPPSLAGGQITVSSPQVSSLGADGTWTAKLQ